ncbi:hypothetical protein CTAYLR_006503 [Chrysophaeum taylorii]|uniref:Carbamoyl phosphate synthase arginine-specific large chain n=1 Tax=Chrysophaeum taylorii TaxID=2483200 RepID=A0AAD7UMW0_9STRA|nr:hypothetical protein CTAYLR_006503 [Chrysophaeum taylorii]
MRGVRESSSTKDDPSTFARVALVLEDGSVFEGRSFGASVDAPAVGEVVFQTGMVGYAEALTDPSYRGQILSMTYPMVGNYGVPAYEEMENGLPRKTFESSEIHAMAMICQDYSVAYSHWDAARSLGAWLAEQGVPGLTGIDTRRLAKILRERGSMLGKIESLEKGSSSAARSFAGAGPGIEALRKRHLVDEVSAKRSGTVFAPPRGTAIVARALAIDCGMKANMVRELNARGVEVTVLRWDDTWATDNRMDAYDGVFLSNGPGDPVECGETIREVRAALDREGEAVRPIFGICLGNQLVGLAAGAKTKKLRFGNRGQNQPVSEILKNSSSSSLSSSGACFVTSQNHGYAVDDKHLPEHWSTLYRNENDGSNEGLAHDRKPFFTAQFHPEANGGPNDAAFLFDRFVRACVESREHRENTAAAPPAAAGAAAAFQQQQQQQQQERKAKPRKVLLLGSGGLSIGQAGEFDYSGAQAIKALKEEGVEVVLMNPNIASVQTNVDPKATAEDRRRDPGAADHVFFVPVTPEFVERVIERERPDAILISMGGQTALNCGIELDRRGVFEKYGVEVLGTQIDAVIATEDREVFKQKLREIGEPVAQSVAVSTVEDAVSAARDVTGYPCMARAAFALGGLGSGIVENEDAMRTLARKALAASPQLLIERSMLGWKEVEYEVVRDLSNNCITVCNMENFDPLGVHTGDSIVVAPSQTLSNDEYHLLRDAALRVVRHLGIVGECNIQYALHPSSREYCVIEVNPRLSRSSALASKATGYPLAFVAAKLAMGMSLPELRNKVTGGATTACFEPALDYCVVKVPRWDLGKFRNASRVLGSAMASVGEVMAIGRTFEESFQKALRMVDPAFRGFEPNPKALEDLGQDATLDETLRVPTDRRVWAIAEAMYGNKKSVDEIHDLTKIDEWFLRRLENIASFARNHRHQEEHINHYDTLLRAKQLGFSDAQIGTLFFSKNQKKSDDEIRAIRKRLGVEPRVKQIDTLAGEFAASTNYLYTTYHGDEDDDDGDTATAHHGGRKVPRGGVLVLGSGAYRIGSSVEFDWCAVSAMRALRSSGARGIMINCNPETVSTDYDECDALYFEELSKERVLDVYEREGVDVGVVVSMGGQIPQNLAVPLSKSGALVLGTPPEMIDAAEDRSKFSALVDRAGVRQPRWAELESHDAAARFAQDVGYPVLVRPSYVLSGAAMAVCRDEPSLRAHLDKAKDVSREHPVVVSKFVAGARELEVDAVAKNGVVLCAAVHEHVEDAGVHSGDATLVLPPHTVSAYALRRARDATAAIADALKISGPMNVQFLVGGPGMNDVQVIECNLRASRSVPFVSKATGVDFAEVATRILADLPLLGTNNLPPLYPTDNLMRPKNFVAVKAPMFSFPRLRGADPALGVEMASTGEVACFGADAHEAFLKAVLATNTKLPAKGDKVLVSFAEPYAHRALSPAYLLHELGYEILATKRTADFLERRGVPCTRVAFPTDTDDILGPDIKDAAEVLRDGSVKLAVNLHAPESTRLADNYLIRRTAADFQVALITNTQLFEMYAAALARHQRGELLALNPVSLFQHYESETSDDAWTDVDEFH